MQSTWRFWLLGLMAAAAHAEILPLGADQDLIGEPGQTTAEHEDTLPDIARHYHLGFDEIIAANPGVDPWSPGAGRSIAIPNSYILPEAPRAGIVLDALRVQGSVWRAVLIADPDVSMAPSMGAWVQAGSSIARASASGTSRRTRIAPSGIALPVVASHQSPRSIARTRPLFW